MPIDPIQSLADCARRERSRSACLATTIGGGALYLTVYPAVVIWVSGFLSPFIAFTVPRGAERVIAALSIGLALGILAWCLRMHWHVGRGTPMPVAPPRKLIVSGPYRYCRNPIHLGTLGCYFGLAVLFADLATGLVTAALTLAIAFGYYKLVEEKELLLRFGDEYRRYRETTPFLIPRLGRRRGDR